MAADIYSINQSIFQLANLGTAPKARISGELANAPAAWTPVSTLGTFWSTGPDQLRAKAGGAAADTFGGTGANTVSFVGVNNATGRLTVDTIALAGIAASAFSAVTFRGLVAVFTSICGTGQTNAAAITIEDGTGDVLRIPAGQGFASYGAACTPDNAIAVVRRTGFASSAATVSGRGVNYNRTNSAKYAQLPQFRAHAGPAESQCEYIILPNSRFELQAFGSTTETVSAWADLEFVFKGTR